MTTIYCRSNSNKHDFYLNFEGYTYYLFSQPFRYGVDEFFKNGVKLDKAINHGIGRSDFAIHHTMDKLKAYIKYIETEYEVIILKQTKRKKAAA